MTDTEHPAHRGDRATRTPASRRVRRTSPTDRRRLGRRGRTTVRGRADADGATPTEARRPTGRRRRDLFRQSEIAADYVEGLLDILDYDGDIDELVSAGRPVVEVVGGRLQPLVGQRGATLEALQELTRLAMFRQTGSPSRLLLDVGGYRANRRKELARRRQERGREGQGVRRAGAPGADVARSSASACTTWSTRSPAWRASRRASSPAGGSWCVRSPTDA